MIEKINTGRIWDKEPVFCFTSDVDWASDEVLELFLSQIDGFNLKPTIFVTHGSAVVDNYKKTGRIERGLHPNFLPNSSHGDDFRTVIETCIKFAPEARCFRAHRGFDVTDITHLLTEYGIEYDSNVVTIMQERIRPMLHESGLVRFPIFFEDGTHLYNCLELGLDRYVKLFKQPGIKIVSFHPMNYVINPPTLRYMRSIKDALSREEYNNMTVAEIEKYKHRGSGITDVTDEIIEFASQYKVMALSELFELAVS